MGALSWGRFMRGGAWAKSAPAWPPERPVRPWEHGGPVSSPVGSRQRGLQRRLEGVLAAPMPLLPAAIYYPSTPPLSAVEHQAGAYPYRGAKRDFANRARAGANSTGRAHRGCLAARPPSMRPTCLNPSRSRWALRNAPRGITISGQTAISLAASRLATSTLNS